MLRIKNLGTCLRCCLVVASLWTLFIIVSLSWRAEHTAIEELDKCPVCYGQTMCRRLRNVRVSSQPEVLSKWPMRQRQIMPPPAHKSSFVSRWWNFAGAVYNVKNVFYGRSGDSPLVFKKLAHSSELRAFDDQVCRFSNGATTASSVSCSANRFQLYKLFLSTLFVDVYENNSSSMSVSPGRNVSYRVASHVAAKFDHLTCASDRTVKFLYDANRDRSPLRFYHFSTMLFINPEPLILQAFPQSDGWPFPHYYGACGRVVGEQYIGPPLSAYYPSEWSVRVQLALQLLEICDVLTAGVGDFNLYLTDVDADNMAVDVHDGRLYVVDVENVVIVDRRQIRRDNAEGWNRTHVSAVLRSDCMAFELDQLCTHSVSDHNYMSVCRGLLASDAVSHQMPGGLLHDPPYWVLETHPELTVALQLCSDPTLASRTSTPTGGVGDDRGGDSMGDLDWVQVGMSRILVAEKLKKVLNRILSEIS